MALAEEDEVPEAFVVGGFDEALRLFRAARSYEQKESPRGSTSTSRGRAPMAPLFR